MAWKAISSSNPLKKKAVAALRDQAAQPKAKVTNVKMDEVIMSNRKPGVMVQGDLMVKPGDGGRGGKFEKLGTFTATLQN